MERIEEGYVKCASQVTADLLECSIRLQRLLAAADLFPLGGLYEGHYAEQAIRRYWDLWMPLLLQHQRTREPAQAALLVPPLDVQWAWFVHRLNPNKYLDDCRARFGRELHPASPQQALGFSGCGLGCSSSSSSSSGSSSSSACGAGSSKGPHTGAGAAGGVQALSESEEYTRRAWAAAYPAGPGLPPEHMHWPPAPAWLPGAATAAAAAGAQHAARHTPRQETSGPTGSKEQGAAGAGAGAGAGPTLEQAAAAAAGKDVDGQDQGRAAAAAGGTASVRSYVIEAMPRQGRFLHQVLRAPYFSHSWLAAGVRRYLRFLAMARSRVPGEPLLVPMYDIDLAWHSHMALSGAYAADCRALLPSGSSGSSGDSGGGGGGGGRVLGHDDGLAGPALADPFAYTRRKYEADLGLMYNVAPTRRIPTSLAHPLVAAVWPLAAVLDDPRPPAPPPPPPRAVRAQLSGQVREPPRLLSCTVVAADGGVSWGPGGARNPEAAAAALAGSSRRGGSSSHKGKAAGAARATAVGGSSAGGAKGSAGFATATGEWARCMLGSPDHLKRSGAIGLFALWRLAEALKQLAGPGVGVGSSSSDSRRGGGGSSRGAGGGGGGGGWGGRPHLFSCLLGGGAGLEEARVDAALSHMTADLLQLCDPAHPHSPVTSSDHTFWRALFPLPAEGESKAETRTPPGAGAAAGKASSASASSTCGAAEPSSSSSKAVATGGTACSPHGPTPVRTDTDIIGVTINITAASIGAAAPHAAPTTCPSCHPCTTPQPELLPPRWLPAPPRPSRFPAPPPALDVPAGFAPAGARDVDCVWLAPHHWVLPAPVFYTHADFCALGRGSWCLPPRLADPEASGGSADPRHLLPLQPLQLLQPLQPPHQQEPPGSTTSSGSSGTSQQQQQQQRQYADAGEDFDFEWEDEWDVAGGRRGGRGGRGRGRGSSINVLGAIVHSPLWHKRLLRCYSRVYAELMRRRKATQPDCATALAWGLSV